MGLGRVLPVVLGSVCFSVVSVCLSDVLSKPFSSVLAVSLVDTATSKKYITYNKIMTAPWTLESQKDITNET